MKSILISGFFNLIVPKLGSFHYFMVSVFFNVMSSDAIIIECALIPFSLNGKFSE